MALKAGLTLGIPSKSNNPTLKFHFCSTTQHVKEESLCRCLLYTTTCSKCMLSPPALWQVKCTYNLNPAPFLWVWLVIPGKFCQGSKQELVCPCNVRWHHVCVCCTSSLNTVGHNFQHFIEHVVIIRTCF